VSRLCVFLTCWRGAELKIKRHAKRLNSLAARTERAPSANTHASSMGRPQSAAHAKARDLGERVTTVRLVTTLFLSLLTATSSGARHSTPPPIAHGYQQWCSSLHSSSHCSRLPAGGASRWAQLMLGFAFEASPTGQFSSSWTLNVVFPFEFSESTLLVPTAQDFEFCAAGAASDGTPPRTEPDAQADCRDAGGEGRSGPEEEAA
jgi:hypothetical protein